MASYAAACEAVCAKVAPDAPWILGGMSMGGYVVLEMVRRGRVAIRALILADTRAVLDTPEQREWDAIVRRDGLKAALAWRDRRYDERLSERRSDRRERGVSRDAGS